MKDLLSKYLQFNNDGEFYGTVYGKAEKDYQLRWAFWIRKIIQLSLLEDFLDIIPKQDFKMGSENT